MERNDECQIPSLKTPKFACGQGRDMTSNALALRVVSGVPARASHHIKNSNATGASYMCMKITSRLREVKLSSSEHFLVSIMAH